MRVLVTGGAGYIGNFMTKRLLESGHDVVVADSLKRGHKELIDQKAKLLVGDLLDKKFVENIFNQYLFDSVIHLAGYISMRESMEEPGFYFHNNIFSALNVLEEMKKKNITSFIFSSTAGIYGNPVKLPIPEDHPKNPTNPYGESKLMVEQILNWYQKLFGLNFASLRYFNACGASLDGTLGEQHYPETHIIPNAVNAVLESSKFILFGDDYATPDGTCIRDYVHVVDLVEAHMLALSKLQKEKGAFFYNVGIGKGYSNKEVISMVEKVSRRKLNLEVSGRRPGDAEVLVSDPKKINSELGFSPKYSDLETIVKTAWEWHKKAKNEK